MTCQHILLFLIKKGDLEALIWLFKKYKREIKALNNNRLLENAAGYGFLHICKWLITLPKKYGIDPAANDNLTFKCSAYNGRIHICKWLLSLPKEFGIDSAEIDIKSLINLYASKIIKSFFEN